MQVQVIVNIVMRHKTIIVIQTQSRHFEQKFEYDLFPKFCNSCKMYGHFADECRNVKQSMLSSGLDRGQKVEKGEESIQVRMGSKGLWLLIKAGGRVDRIQETGVGKGTWLVDKAHMSDPGPDLASSNNNNNNNGSQPGTLTPSTFRIQGKKWWLPTNFWCESAGDPWSSNSPGKRRRTNKYGRTSDRVPDIPKSPNKFELVRDADNGDAKENAVASKEAHFEMIKDIIAAAIPPILAGLQSNGSLNFQAPYLNSVRRHRSSSRDPRIHREGRKGDEAEEGAANDVHCARESDEKVDVVEETMNKDAGTTEGNGRKNKNKKHEKSESRNNVVPVPGDVPNAEVTSHGLDKIVDEELNEQEKEAGGHLSQSEKRGNSTKRRKSKSTSKSRGKKNEENMVITSNWEDGLEDDPGNAQ